MGTVWKCGRLGVVQPTGFSEWAWNGAIFVNMGRPWSTKFPGE